MLRSNTAHTAALRAVTDAGGMRHLVTDEAMIIGRRLGRYVACCGVEVLAASLTGAGHRSVPSLSPLAGRGVIARRSVTRRWRRWRAGRSLVPAVATSSVVPLALPAAGPDPDTATAGVSDSHLAVLVLQTSWALADAAHDLPAGRMSAQRREELADTVQALGFIIRAASAPDGER